MARSYGDVVVVLTGAGSGIGRELAVRLARQGARLALVGRRHAKLEETALQAGTTALVMPCDVTDAAQVEALAHRVQAELGVPEVLVNNAGRGAHGRFEEVAVADHRAVIDTNLLGVVQVTHAFLPAMLTRGRGQLVFVSSVLGELPAPEHAVYGATKFAVTAFGESLAYELQGRGVEVTVVEPGLVRSEFADVSGTPRVRFEQLPSKSSAQAAAAVLRAMAGGRRHHVADRLSAVAIGLRRHAPRLLRLLFGVAYRRSRARR